jgi:hypothetical protein
MVKTKTVDLCWCGPGSSGATILRQFDGGYIPTMPPSHFTPLMLRKSAPNEMSGPLRHPTHHQWIDFRRQFRYALLR